MPYIERFHLWLDRRPTWRELPGLLIDLYFIQTVWVVLVLLSISAVLHFAVISFPRIARVENLDTILLSKPPWRRMLVILTVVSIEELAFRFVPFTIALFLKHKGWLTNQKILWLALLCSLAFGLVHVSNHAVAGPVEVIMSLLIQGGIGGSISVLFLKYCGMQLRYVVGALFICILFHYAWDFVLMSHVLFAR